MRIFVFEGSSVDACESLAAAELNCEAIDVRNNEYEFIGDDGTLIRPSVRGELVVLTPTSEKRPEELRERLRIYLAQPTVTLDESLADNPAALAELIVKGNKSEIPHPFRRITQSRFWPGASRNRNG